MERRQQAEADLDEASSALSEAQEKQVAAAGQHDAVLTQLSGQLTDWAGACRELAFPEPDALIEAIEPESALIALIDRVAAGVLEGIIKDETITNAQLEELCTGRDDLAGQLRRLSTEVDLPPDAPPYRTADRGAMTGAPFWRLVDFAGPIPGHVRGPVEAALQAAGLLDAWVGPSGSIPSHDIFADPGALAPAPGRSLADVLVPSRLPPCRPWPSGSC